MHKNRLAYSLLLRSTLPDLPEKMHQHLLDIKFRCLAACQRYGVMSVAELKDMEFMLEEMPSLTIAYIVQESGVDGEARFFSCLTDGRCAVGADFRRRPHFRVELPGQPILGNGKSDNQNHAIIFSRGTILQAIDANQEGCALNCHLPNCSFKCLPFPDSPPNSPPNCERCNHHHL